MKKFISSILAAAVCFSSVAFAKSDSLIDGNIDKMRDLLYEKDFRVFTENSPECSVYYGAKFEPRSGVILGTPENCKFEGINNGINTCYDWFVPSDEITNDRVAREEIAEVPSNHTELIGWNWNFSSQKPIDMNCYENYIKNYIDRLAAMGKDILLVFGKEMNIDDNFLDEQVFIDCFRYVANYAHTKENIAMVWAPNDTGGLDTRLIDFYPGSEYVDWIGCSLYTMPHFTGNKHADDGANMCFIMGDYANPVMRAKVIHRFMTEYGIQKPVFITEGGVGYVDPDGTDYTDWSVQQLRKYYGELVRVYPEFKCIVSFNNYVADGDYYRYDMGNNPTLLENMQYLAQDPIFITHYPDNAPISYTEVFDGIDFIDKIKISAYGYMPKNQWMTVRYIIDDEVVKETSYPPYPYETTNMTEGNHHLRTEFYRDGDLVRALDYDFGFKRTPPEPQRVYHDEADSGSCKFSDMNDMPAEMKNAAAKLSEKGIITGKSTEHFAPSDNVTRAELAAMLSRAFQLNNGTAEFGDVVADAWYHPYVAAVGAAGIMNGFENGNFDPNASITNEQLSAVTARYRLAHGGLMPNLALTFADSVSDWAQDFVRVAVADGFALPYDDNTFKGGKAVTRGDCAVILNRLLAILQ